MEDKQTPEEILKTSEHWEKEIDSDWVILDPDGWDRSNWQYSWHEELISKAEYLKRMMRCTVMKKNF